MLFMNIVVHTHIYTHPCGHEHIRAHVCEHVHEQMFKNSGQVIPSTGTMSEAAEVMPWTSMKKITNKHQILSTMNCLQLRKRKIKKSIKKRIFEK